jgi:hypothetical protein
MLYEIKRKRGQSWKQGVTIHEHIGSLWSGFLTRNPVSPILRSYAGRMVLSAQHVALFQSRGIKLGGDWFAPGVATKHLPLAVRSSIKHVHPLQLGLRRHGT